MGNEAESERIRSALKEILRKKGIRYNEVAQCLSLSLPRFKSLMSRGNLSLERIMRICDYLDISFYDLVEVARNKISETQRYLTEDQESYLIKHPSGTRFLIEIMNGKRPEEIIQAFKLTEKSGRHYVSALESMGLVRKDGKRVKLSHGIPLGPRPGGVLSQYLRRSYSMSVPELVKSEFSVLGSREASRSKTESFKCSGLNLSYKSRLLLKRDLEELWTKYILLEHVEYASGQDQDSRQTTLLTSFKEYDLFASAFPGIKNI